MLDPTQIKKDFPILNKEINGKSLVFLDNASTSQKPQIVIDAIKDFYENYNANINRGVYYISELASVAYEEVRKKTANFINAENPKNIIFTKNTTEAINLVAYSWGNQNLNENDEIIISALEHHSNLIPWQELAKRKGAILKLIPLTEDFQLDFEVFEDLLSEKTKLLAITSMSNVTGTIPDLKKFINKAHEFNVKVMVDGAQGLAHIKTDVQDLNCDFLAFSAHKMLGPTGVGVLYTKEEMPPLLFGGGIVKEVTETESTFLDGPEKFDAGTANIADVIAFGQALEYLKNIELTKIHEHEVKLAKKCQEMLNKYPEVKLYCPTEPTGIISFTIDGIHPHDIAQVFDEFGVCIRAGHHCNQPLMKTLGLTATARISFYLYNTEKDIEIAEEALQKCIQIFK